MEAKERYDTRWSKLRAATFETAQTNTSNTSNARRNIQIERALIKENQHNRGISQTSLSEKKPNLINKFLDKQKLEKIRSFPATGKGSKGELATLIFHFQSALRFTETAKQKTFSPRADGSN